jgi:hypothetical protein
MTGFRDRLRTTDRTLVLSDPDGAVVFELDILYAAAGGAAAVLMAPRITAIAALAALLRGMSVTVSPAPAPAQDA